MRKLLTAFVVICLAILFLPPLALAQSDYITELTVSTATAESYERVKISVSFSDGGASDPVFHSGDTLTVSWPSVGGASLQGMTRTIHLVNPEGITYAHAYITPTGASVVFTDAVEGMSDVHGSFWFEATAVNKTDTTEENAETVVIHAGNKTAELIIHKGESAGISEGELPLFRKQADEIGGGWAWDDEVHGYVMGLDPSDPTYTQWILTVNEHMEEVHTDVKVHDLLGEGQSLDESYLRLYSGGAIKKTYEGTVREVIDAWEQDFPLSSLTFDESGNIDWVIDRQTADRTYWNLTYRCDIIDFEKALLSNSAEISYTDGQDHPQLLHDESYFFNTDAGGGAEGLPPGMVRVRKRVAGTELGIAGVVFRLEKKALDGTWDLAGTLTTNADGIAVISRLKSGEYRLYEIEYPDYLTAAYTLDAPYFFTIDRENAEERGVELVAENALQLIDIEVQKRWLDADGNEDASAHPTMIFRLFRQSDAQNIPVHVSDRTLTSGAVTVTWADLPAFDVFGNRYTYTISELDEQENTWPESNVSLTGDAVQGFLLTNRATPSPSPSPTPTPTPTPAATPTATPSSAPTPTPTLTATPTATPSPTPMLTASPTPAVTPTIMPSPSSTPSPTSTPVLVASLTVEKRVVGGLSGERRFPITLYFLTPEGEPLRDTFQTEEGLSLQSGDTIRLADGEAVVVLGLPVGTIFQVQEGDVLGYLPAYETSTDASSPDQIGPSGASVTIRNQVETVDFTVYKQWIGGEAGGIELTLGAVTDGQFLPLSESPNAERQGNAYIFRGLPKYDQAGAEIIYAVQEKTVAGYGLKRYVNRDAHVTAYALNGATIVNTRTTQVLVQKVWKGVSEDIQTPSITLTLYKDGQATTRRPTLQKDGWYRFDNLETGHAYYVLEEPLAGYQTTYENTGEYADSVDCAYHLGKIVNYQLPSTGDREPLSLWGILGLLSIVGLIVWVYLHNRNVK